ncbi:MAG: prephenate dehydrogenase/arogenate dehydrogenase family protein [Chloroflexi bacterium]|nr:prephenate dehydrogenase/arogenate dehydrogenase family protein [Chloroflexota bacterium]
MQRVLIVGLGLIGGSIGLALRRWSEERKVDGRKPLEVVGFDPNLDHQRAAEKLGAVDKGAWDLSKAARESDVVVLATPVKAMRDVMEDLVPHLRPGTIVLDTGSTKAQVLKWANEVFPREVHFVGSHPMAGKTQSIEGADADLFVGATWCVSPSVTASEDAVRTVLGLIAAAGAEPFFIDAEEHDAFVAGVSHVPFVLSAALMNAVARDASWRDMKTLTAGGFRDTTRLAAGSPAMHRDIVLTNRDAVTRWIDAVVDTLGELRQIIASNDENAASALDAYFNEARDARAVWATQTTREGELLQGTAAELQTESVSDHMGRMFLGGFAKRLRTPPTRDAAPPRSDR